jgi:hypothetical protein
MVAVQRFGVNLERSRELLTTVTELRAIATPARRPNQGRIPNLINRIAEV